MWGCLDDGELASLACRGRERLDALSFSCATRSLLEDLPAHEGGGDHDAIDGGGEGRREEAGAGRVGGAEAGQEVGGGRAEGGGGGGGGDRLQHQVQGSEQARQVVRPCREARQRANC